MASLENFELPQALVVDEETATPRYAKFIAEPFENGFGHTIGNALRRVLLSSMEGVAVASVKIDGVSHEFTTMPDVMEDVMEIVLNIKKLKFNCDGALPRTLELHADKAGAVTGANICEDGVTQVLNPEQVICTLDKDTPIRMELVIDRGRGFRSAEENKIEDQPIGTIPVDCLFSPIERVRYDVHACRVGQHTDYDRLELEVWTDGRIDPREAVSRSAVILREHLLLFATGDSSAILAPPAPVLSEEELALVDRLCLPISELQLSVRCLNCLNFGMVHFIGELVEKSESQLLKFRNFGKKSLMEIKEKLTDFGFDLEMDLTENVREELGRRLAQQSQTNEGQDR